MMPRQNYIPNWLKSAITGLGKYWSLELEQFGTFLHSNAGSGHLAHGGHGGHGSCLGHAVAGGQAGQTGGTISDFKIYKSSVPGTI